LTPAALSRPLSLQDCLRLSRQNDVHVAQWTARLASARAELTTARTLPNPVFQGTWEDIGIHAAGQSLATSAYGFSYPLFFWWTRGKQIAVARQNLRAQEQAVRADQRQLAVEIGSAYFTLLAAGRKVQATDELLKSARDSLRLADESFHVGLISGHDAALARTEVTQAEADLFDARHEQRAQNLAFAFALGADRPREVLLQEREQPLPVPLAADAPSTAVLPEALLVRALQADPAYAKARAEREAAEAGLQLEYRQAMPLSEAQATGQRKRAPEGVGSTWAFEIPIPLFNRNQGGIAKAKADLLTARTEEEKARRDVAAGLAVAWEGYSAASQRRHVYAEPITRSRARLAQDANDLFVAGQINYSDLQLARREWRQAELAAVDSWRESMVAAWKILCALGGEESRFPALNP